jgi:hypothetical protein
MTGLISWAVAGAAAALLARLVPRRRGTLWIEALAALAAALAGGLVATALDFGGIAALDARSAAFAFALAAAAIAAVRLSRTAPRGA